MMDFSFAKMFKAEPDDGGEDVIQDIPNLCSQCANLITTGPGLSCKAFPKGIPFVILTHQWDHHMEFPGDHGITFDPKPDARVDYGEGVFKGDVTGHEFHGNQWTEATFGKRDAHGNYPILVGKEKIGDIVSSSYDRHSRKSTGPGYDVWLQHKGKTLKTSSDLLSEVKNAVNKFVKEVYSQPPVKKGDTPGHEFHGNQWTKVGGAQGSNPGGSYLSPSGEKHYVKFPNARGQAKAEQVSDAIHELLGAQTMNHKAIDINGKTGSASKWKQIDILGPNGWKHLDDRQKAQAATIFIASALTKNWDVVGAVYDNMGTDKNGNLAIIDTGGSFQFRAQGAHKDFGGDAQTEIHAMLNPEKTSGRVFGPLMRSNPEVFVDAARGLKDIPNKTLVKTALDSGLPDRFIEPLLQRKQEILNYFSV